MYLNKIVIISFLIASVGVVKAQQDLTLINLDNVQQVQYVNPALRPLAKVNVGLPGASSTYFNYHNSVFTPKAFFDVNGSNTTLRTEHLKKMWQAKNDISLSGKYDILHFGFAVKKNYFSFNITENFYSRLTLPGDMLRFPFTGNAKFDELKDGTLDFSGFGVELNHYREYALGFQRVLNDKLSVGGKLKYLYGMENIHTKKSDFTWRTDPDTYDWTFNGEFAANSSGIYSLADSIDGNTDLENEDVNSYLFKRKNRGLGIDIGGTYQWSEKLGFSASLIDLGFIRWKNDTRNVVSNKGEFIFTGIDFSNAVLAADSVQQDSIDAAYEQLQSNFENTFGVTDNTNKYTTALMSRFYLGASYQLYKTEKYSGKAGVLLHGGLYRRTIIPTLTLSYTQNLGKMLQLTGSYSMMRRSFNNLGLGMSLNLGPIQFYVVTDNILAANLANLTIDGESTPYPYNAKNVHFRTGFNITIGRKDKDKDKDGIKDKKDDCPEVPGLEIYNGCPDSDNDSIPDNKDLCPSQAGVKEFSGCPDSDGDGIKDSEDGCPTAKGLRENRGCPDTDGDGIVDEEDACPEMAGITAFKGCPDTDGDGIQDSEDECPKEVGAKDMNGCPDSDNDNIPDHKDACPNEAGELENKGCPWGDIDNDGVKDNVDKCPSVFGLRERDGCPLDDRDADGVPDAEDECPNTPGLAVNKGCPALEKEEQEILNTAFDNLEFESGKAVIKETSYASLLGLAELMNKKPEWKLKIEGHTDSDGSASANLKLSKDRAQSVANYLKTKGIALERLKAEGFGEAQPIADNKTAEGKQKNRRVVMTILFE